MQYWALIMLVGLAQQAAQDTINRVLFGWMRKPPEAERDIWDVE